jgi:hypothetical protein
VKQDEGSWPSTTVGGDMSVNGINGNGFDFSKLLGGKATTPVAGSSGAVDFSSALKLQMASIQSE